MAPFSGCWKTDGLKSLKKKNDRAIAAPIVSQHADGGASSLRLNG
jgi:hypothetical protein